MKKRLTAIALGCSLLFGGQVFAADTPAAATTLTPVSASTDSATTSTAVYSPTDIPSNVETQKWYTEINGKYQQIIQLRSDDNAIDAQLKEQTEKNKAAAKEARHGLTEAEKVKIKEVRELNKQILTGEVKSLGERIKALRAQIKDAHKAGKEAREKGDAKGADVAQVAMIQMQIKQLQEQMKAAQAKIQANKDSIKDLLEREKAARQAAKALHDQGKSLLAQQKGLWEQVKQQHVLRHEGWQKFWAAVKAGNLNDALAGLDQVISAKTQIIALKKQILEVKVQIYNVYTTPATTPTTTTPAAGTSLAA